MTRPETERTTPQAIELEFHQLGLTIVNLRGHHDLLGKQRLTEAVADASEHLNVLVDLSECTFIDSAVISVLSSALERLVASGGRFELVIPPEASTVNRVATVTALAAVLPIHKSRSAGIASFEPREHVIQVRDVRLRFGDPEAFAAQCSCGWKGEVRSGWSAERTAQRDGAHHTAQEREIDSV